MDSKSEIFSIIVHAIFLVAFLFECYRTFFGSDKHAKTIRRKLLYKFKYPLFWLYCLGFIFISFIIENNYFTKDINKDLINNIRKSIKLGWIVFITTFFAQAGYTISLACIVVFLALYFKIFI